jgi:hypothetical protein
MAANGQPWETAVKDERVLSVELVNYDECTKEDIAKAYAHLHVINQVMFMFLINEGLVDHARELLAITTGSQGALDSFDRQSIVAKDLILSTEDEDDYSEVIH